MMALCKTKLASVARGRGRKQKAEVASRLVPLHSTNLEDLDPRLTRWLHVSTGIRRKLRGKPLPWPSHQSFPLCASIVFPRRANNMEWGSVGRKPCMVIPSCNSSTWDVKRGESGVEGQHQLHTEFKASLIHMTVERSIGRWKLEKGNSKDQRTLNGNRGEQSSGMLSEMRRKYSML